MQTANGYWFSGNTGLEGTFTTDAGANFLAQRRTDDARTAHRPAQLNLLSGPDGVIVTTVLQAGEWEQVLSTRFPTRSCRATFVDGGFVVRGTLLQRI